MLSHDEANKIAKIKLLSASGKQSIQELLNSGIMTDSVKKCLEENRDKFDEIWSAANELIPSGTF